MDGQTVRKLYQRLPHLTHKLNVSQIESMSGSRFRLYIVILTAIPLFQLCDLNGGFTKLGFTRTAFQQEFKARPDYLTNTLFLAQRHDLPEFKQL
jgi:hypothetical protein